MNQNKTRKRINKIQNLFLSLLTVSLLCGCINTKRSYPTVQYFMLNAEREESKTVLKKDVILRISNIVSEAPFDDKSFVYKVGESQYTMDSYNQFLISPRNNLTQEVRAWAEASKIFDKVVSGNSRLGAQYYLEGSLKEMVGDYQNESTAILKIQFFLMQKKSGDTEVLMLKNYSEKITLADKKPETLIKGWNTALENILKKLETDIKTTLK